NVAAEDTRLDAGGHQASGGPFNVQDVLAGRAVDAGNADEIGAGRLGDIGDRGVLRLPGVAGDKIGEVIVQVDLGDQGVMKLSALIGRSRGAQGQGVAGIDLEEVEICVRSTDVVANGPENGMDPVQALSLSYPIIGFQIKIGTAGGDQAVVTFPRAAD